MRLRYSPTSPYVRKVTATAHELGLDERIERVPTNAWDPASDLPGDNPLGKVPTLLLDDEWLDVADEWSIPAGDHAAARTVDLPSDGLGFQLCGIPVIYRRGTGSSRITLVDRDGERRIIEGDRIDGPEARPIFDRKASIERIEIDVASA